jgi:hypothetical protein
MFKKYREWRVLLRTLRNCRCYSQEEDLIRHVKFHPFFEHLLVKLALHGEQDAAEAVHRLRRF